MYCPNCRRELVSFNEDGTLNLAEKARIEMLTQIDFEEEEAEGVVIEAFCLRRVCRLRSSLDKHRMRLRR